MKILGNLKSILSGWTASLSGKIPENPDEWPEYFRYRMRNCEECEYNTRNMTKEEMDKYGFVNTALGKKRDRCAICGCFVKEKCWVKEEICSLAEKGESAKWRPEATVVNASKNFEIENLKEELYTVGEMNDGYEFVVKMNKPIEQGKEVKFNYALNGKNKIIIGNPTLSCGCITGIGFETPTRKRTITNITISTETMPLGVFDRNIIMRYSDDLGKGEKAIRVHFRGEVIEAAKKEDEKKESDNA